MNKESERLGTLVQQIIELSRLQGDEPLEMPSRVSVDEVVATAIDTSAIDAAARVIASLRKIEFVMVWPRRLHTSPLQAWLRGQIRDVLRDRAGGPGPADQRAAGLPDATSSTDPSSRLTR